MDANTTDAIICTVVTTNLMLQLLVGPISLKIFYSVALVVFFSVIRAKYISLQKLDYPFGYWLFISMLVIALIIVNNYIVQSCFSYKEI